MSDFSLTQSESHNAAPTGGLLQERAVPQASPRLQAWEQQIADFSRQFEQDVSEIVAILRHLAESDLNEAATSRGPAETVPLTTPVEHPSPTHSQPETQPAPASSAPAAETDRFSALKARLSQQLASAGQAAAAFRPEHSDADGGHKS
jgi:hypothetical protein